MKICSEFYGAHYKLNTQQKKKRKKYRNINLSFFYIYILHKKIIYPDADGKKKEFTKRYTFFLL